MADFLRKRGEKYHFRKRIPKNYQAWFQQEYIQIPLGTDSETIALKRASNFNQLFEEFLQGLSTENHIESEFKALVLKAKRSGFQYITHKEVIKDIAVSDFVNRINTATMMNNTGDKKSVLGDINITKPSIELSKALKEYFEHEKGNLTALSESQFHKWKNPRTRAVNNFIKVIGDKPVSEFVRQDIQDFRTWWINKVTNDGLSTNTANKEFGFIKQALKSANINHNLDISVDTLFKEIRLKEVEKTKRFPFSTSFIQEKLFTIDDSLNAEARLLIFAMADTGARIGELIGLEDNDILLNHDIPHIKIRPNATRSLKTPQSERDLPLVGASLFAFKELNGTFNRYFGKASLISTTINKYCRENDIFPSKNHSLYSLRHSFEDRLTAIEPPDKVQAALMGHKYSRPRYGLGPTLAQKKIWLDKIAFKI